MWDTEGLKVGEKGDVMMEAEVGGMCSERGGRGHKLRNASGY